MRSVDKQQSDAKESTSSSTQSSKLRRVNVSLIVALLALIVSGLSFYFQSIYVDEALYLTISRHEFNEKGMVAFDATFSNGGNKTIAIPDIWIKVTKDVMGIPDADLFKTSLKTIVLKPGEAVTKRFCVAIAAFTELEVGAEQPVMVKLSVEIVTTAGRSLIAETEISAHGRDASIVTQSFKDGEVVTNTPGYLVVARRGVIDLLHEHDDVETRPQDNTVAITMSASGLKNEFDRRKGLFLEKLRANAGCS